jgi:hypothetical protein
MVVVELAGAMAGHVEGGQVESGSGWSEPFASVPSGFFVVPYVEQRRLPSVGAPLRPDVWHASVPGSLSGRQ